MFVGGPCEQADGHQSVYRAAVGPSGGRGRVWDGGADEAP